MQNYYMEFRKFTSRNFNATYPINAIEPHETLCQEILFDLTSNSIERDGLTFSLAFFYDYRKIREGTDFNSIYLIDGVAWLHKFSGSEFPLVRNRDLYYYLYIDRQSASAFARALVSNPWLNELYRSPKQYMSDKVESIDNIITNFNSSVLVKEITNELTTDFTPRGVWGLDYMFAWKLPFKEVELKLNDDISLISLDEYVSYF